LSVRNASKGKGKEGWRDHADRIGDFLFVEGLCPPIGEPGLKLNCRLH
jgi:hypothetical protein